MTQALTSGRQLPEKREAGLASGQGAPVPLPTHSFFGMAMDKVRCCLCGDQLDQRGAGCRGFAQPARAIGGRTDRWLN